MPTEAPSSSTAPLPPIVDMPTWRRSLDELEHARRPPRASLTRSPPSDAPCPLAQGEAYRGWLQSEEIGTLYGAE